jgi:phosphatidylserine decarboxylase
MLIDRAGVPFVAVPLICALLLGLVRRPGWAVPLAAVAGFMLFFFRDPHRQTPSDSHAVVAPADGRVMVAGAPEPGVAPPGQWQQISIFLSPLDVHINRIPFGGRVARVTHHAGRCLPAYRPAAANENERTEIWIERNGRQIVFRQVVGVLARRIVCRIGERDEVVTGQRFGLMKFGSRMDVFVGPGVALLVQPGARVRGGVTVLARFP